MLEGLWHARWLAGAATTPAPARRGARLLLAALVLGCAPVALSAPLPAAARAEVMALLDRLANSGCRFQRNGNWHAGAEARDHLLQKLEYVEKHASATTAEQFIDLAAARSTISGKPYHVQCARADPVQSATWLTQELRALRAARSSAPRIERAARLAARGARPHRPRGVSQGRRRTARVQRARTAAALNPDAGQVRVARLW